MQGAVVRGFVICTDHYYFRCVQSSSVWFVYRQVSP